MRTVKTQKPTNKDKTLDQEARNSLAENMKKNHQSIEFILQATDASGVMVSYIGRLAGRLENLHEHEMDAGASANTKITKEIADSNTLVDKHEEFIDDPYKTPDQKIRDNWIRKMLTLHGAIESRLWAAPDTAFMLKWFTRYIEDTDKEKGIFAGELLQEWDIDKLKCNEPDQ